MTDLLFYIMYVPAKWYRRSRKSNAVNALCWNLCIYSIALINYLGSFIKKPDPTIKIAILAVLFVADIVFSILLSYRLDWKYDYAKVVEVEEKYKTIIGSALAKIIYWLTVMISLLLILSIPFVLLNVHPMLNKN